MSPQDKDNVANRCIALSSLFISLLALIFTVYQGYQTRLHNHLSVLPHIYLDYYMNEAQTGRSGVGIINDGVGPAVITRFRVFYRDKKVVDDSVGTGSADWANIHKVLWPKAMWQPRYAYPTPGVFLQPQVRFFLLEIPPASKLKDRPGDIYCGMAPLKIEVFYKDVYGNEKDKFGEPFKATADASKLPYFKDCQHRPE